MRVLTFTSLFPNPSNPTLGIFVRQRMASFARRGGNQVCVIAPVAYFPSWIPSARWQSGSTVPKTENSGEITVYHPRYLILPKVSMWAHGLLMFLGTVRLARRLHREIRFDCIDAHYVYPDGFAAALLGKLLRIPVVISARGTDINVFPKFRLIRPMIRWTLQRANGIIAVSRALKTAILELGIPPDRVAVIGNGADTSRFFPVPRSWARQQLHVPDESRIVLAVGALDPAKGQRILLRAMAELSGPECHLYLVGSGPDRGVLERLARELDISDRVHFAGNRPNAELSLWYNAADISALISSREGWPNVVLESLACGTPVLATAVGGIPEIIVSSEYGMLVEPSVGAVSKALREGLAKNWNRDRLVQYAQARTWDQVAVEVEQQLKAIGLRAADLG